MRPRSSSALLLVLLAPSCVALEGDGEDVVAARGLEMGELGGMLNVAVVDDIWLGGHASAEDLDLAKRRGVEIVVELGDPAATDVDVAAVCEELGIESVTAPIDPVAPDPDHVDRVLAALQRPDREAVLLLSDEGARCGTILAIYRVVADDLALDTALEEARRIGLKPGVGELAVRRQVARIRNSGER